jgi:mRNA interferase MazF
VRARRGVLYLADLNPRAGTEPGKVRPVLVVQTDLLNEAGHPSTWVLPCTTRLTGENLLRVVLPRSIAGNREECEVMVDQSRAIDNRRLVRALRPLPKSILAEVGENCGGWAISSRPAPTLAPADQRGPHARQALVAGRGVELPDPSSFDPDRSPREWHSRGQGFDPPQLHQLRHQLGRAPQDRVPSWSGVAFNRNWPA